MEITGEVEYGIKLGELEKLLLAHNLTTQTVHVESLDNASKMKHEFIDTLNTTDRYIVINYEYYELSDKKPWWNKQEL